MTIHVEELNRSNCRTYLLSSGDDAVLVPYIDPGVPLARGVAAARTAGG